MKKLTVALAAGLAAASIGLASLATVSPAASLASCGDGWYWNSNTNSCVPNGFPSDPPNGCLTGDGRHVNGTICAN
ncbi:hypothetical protein [Mycobacterium sp. 852002-50816_SCH5313054-b]|uniref:hypothetical protein n=1 Tax=Mycobacterium sp. 852002-50816_SCH5313054-b TaxID=1834092 RepID=UPI000A78BAFB|nr:hypothetical protein [Mycobacterium sp. 852002-50816_SCH5313054-b]